MKILLAFLISFNIFSADYKCGEHPKEDPKFTWTHLANIDVRAIIVSLDAKLCVGILNDQIEIVTYRNDRDSFVSFMVDELRNGKVVLLNGDTLSTDLVRKGPLMTLNISDEVTTDEYKEQKLELKFHRNLKSSGDEDIRVLSFSLNKEHSQDDLLAYYTSPNVDEFNTMGIKINFGLKVKEIELKDFNIERVRIDTQNLKRVQTL